MRFVSAAVAAAIATFVSCSDCPDPRPAALAAQPFGNVCLDTGSCAGGLECLRVQHLADPTANVCSIDCATSTCPGSAVCWDTGNPFDAGAHLACIPSCTTDAHCPTDGATILRCHGTDAGTGLCRPMPCAVDSMCPAGSRCEIVERVCCPIGAQCIRGGDFGFCRR